jgi:PAS domain S-box-containing protein
MRYLAGTVPGPSLSAEEKAWLEDHKVILLGVAQDYPPLDFVSAQGEHQGLAADYLRLLEKRLGIRLRAVGDFPWPQMLEKVRGKELAGVACIAQSEEREGYLRFSKPYFYSPCMVFTRSNHPPLAGLEEMAGKTVAVEDDFLLHRRLAERFPKIRLLPAPSTQAALEALAQDKAQAYVGNLLVAEHILKRNPRMEIKVACAAPWPGAPLRIGVREDWPQLVSILDKALDTITTQEQAEINSKLKFPMVIATRSDAPFITGLEDLAGQTVVAGRGYASHELLAENHPDLILKPTSDVREGLKAVSAGLAHAFVGNLASMTHFSQEAGLTNLAYDNHGRVVYINPAFTRVFGWAAAEVIGRRIDFIPESERETTAKALKEIYGGDGGVHSFESRLYTKEGQIIDASINAAVFLDVMGKPVGLLAALEDITERKRNEAELRQYRQELERLVAERTAELAVAMEKAQEADRLKSAFLASMSHELRTPLNSIIGFTGIILQGLVGPLNQEQAKQMGMVQHSARHLLSLINDVLDISGIEAGQLKVESEPFDLAQLVAEVAAGLKPAAEKKGLSLETRIAPEVGRLLSDRRRVEQILINLLNNALKFTDQGGVQLDCRLDDGLVETSVRDTGIGIEPGDQAKLFQAFRQIDTGLARRYEGTGLGLNICKKLVDLLGGASGWRARAWAKAAPSPSPCHSPCH